MESEKPMEIGRPPKPPNGTASALNSLWKGFGTVTSKQARSGQTGQAVRTTSTAVEYGMRFPIEPDLVDVAGVTAGSGVAGQMDADCPDCAPLMEGVDVDLLLVQKNDQLRDIMDRVDGLKGPPLPTEEQESLFAHAKQLAAEVVHLLHLPSQSRRRRNGRAYRSHYAA